MLAVELGHERFLLATIGPTQNALKLGDVDRVIRQPSLVNWQGRGVVQAYALVEGLLVWVVSPNEVFLSFDRGASRSRDWLIVLKDAEGLTRLGFLADDVRGPVAYGRLGQVTVLSRNGVPVDESR